MLLFALFREQAKAPVTHGRFAGHARRSPRPRA
jgi:hypothetical protein